MNHCNYQQILSIFLRFDKKMPHKKTSYRAFLGNIMLDFKVFQDLQL